MEAECLNGTIAAGDVVAIAVGDGQFGGGMRIGIVLDITPVTTYWKDTVEVKVRVTKSSGVNFGKLPYTKTFQEPKRMVKIVQ